TLLLVALARACRTAGGLPGSVPHNEPAVDVDRLPRHVVGVAASEKAHEAGHIVGSFGAAERDQRGSPLPGLAGLPTLDPAPFVVDLPPYWCIDRTGTDTVRSDPVCRQRLRRGTGNADNAGFTGGVMNHVSMTASVGGDRGGLDQLSTQLGSRNRRLLTHAFGGALQHEKDRTQIDCEHAVPFLLCKLEQRSDFSDARVVEQYIKAPPKLIR